MARKTIVGLCLTGKNKNNRPLHWELIFSKANIRINTVKTRERVSKKAFIGIF